MMTSIEYDEDAAELDIIFTSGKTYRYFDVPLDIYVAFLDADLKGTFFNEIVKDTFVYAEVTAR